MAKKVSVTPLHDRVIVKPAPAEEKTAGGIIIPDTAKEKPQRGTVVAAGPGKKDEPMTVKVGDRVFQSEQDKWGSTASVQYKPSSDFSLTFDAMLGGYDNTEDEYDAAAYSASSRSTLETIHAYDDTTLAEYGMVVLTDVSYTATQHEFLSKERINETDFSQYSATMDWLVNGWDINALVGYSGAEKTAGITRL